MGDYVGDPDVADGIGDPNVADGIYRDMLVTTFLRVVRNIDFI